MKALLEARARAREVAVQVLNRGAHTAEERATFDKAQAEVERLTKQIDKEKAARQKTQYVESVFGEQRDSARELAFGKFLRHGMNELTPEEKRAVERRDGLVEGAPMLTHIGSYNSLGYFVPTGFSNAIEQATKYYAPLMDGSVFRLWKTESGQPIPWPTSNDTAQAATIVGESSLINESDPPANQINFGAYKLSAGVVKTSVELLQDSAFDLEAWLADRFGDRYGRGLENYLTNGTGGGTQPTGLLTAIAASGATPVIATGSAANSGGTETGVNSIGYADLVNLEHSVDPSYRRNAKYMLHDLTLASVKKILDKFGRPLWAPGIAADEPDTINGYQYVVNQSVPSIAASATTVVFGDFTKFVVRSVKAITVQRLTERYAEYGQVGFLSHMRVDSNLLDAGTHPLNVLQQHS